MSVEERKRVLIIGNGSIGSRHRQVAEAMGCVAELVSRHTPGAFGSIREALASGSFHAAVIANRTAEHSSALRELKEQRFQGRILVEKPLAKSCADIAIPDCDGVFIGYVLRFHPGVIRMRELLASHRVLSVNCYCGQYLPEWRPGTDYRQCYSAHKAEGGGVLRDLSHELDLLLVLAGKTRRVAALGGHFSRLEIDSDDLFMLLTQSETGIPGCCHINYLDRNTVRRYAVEYEGGSVELDMINHQLRHNGSTEKFSLTRNQMFEAMYRDLFAERPRFLCPFPEALETMRLIDAAEQASDTGKWMEL